MNILERLVLAEARGTLVALRDQCPSDSAAREVITATLDTLLTLTSLARKGATKGVTS